MVFLQEKQTNKQTVLRTIIRSPNMMLFKSPGDTKIHVLICRSGWIKDSFLISSLVMWNLLVHGHI